ncbi:hypothetical protein [Paenibacillus sp.]|uniref:hypothetical protein n=1 Tax=Paenibacillus sp. TaxID=58172 RepID=UPI002D2B33FA|nr:hypothetical protein [Paenibacillus sp.]HZG85284.1 hypothetical protein [Paenibacillus sp.]
MAERMWNDDDRRRKLGLRTILAAGLLLAVGALFGSRFYGTVQEPYWDVVERAESRAMEELQFAAVTSVERFVGDQPITVVTGVYGEGEERTPVIAWLWGEDGAHVERLDAGVAREELKARVLRERPEARLLRIAPGKLGEEYVWEVYYEVQEDEASRKYYEYYRFRDGAKLETYRLALER